MTKPLPIAVILLYASFAQGAAGNARRGGRLPNSDVQRLVKLAELHGRTTESVKAVRGQIRGLKKGIAALETQLQEKSTEMAGQQKEFDARLEELQEDRSD